MYTINKEFFMNKIIFKIALLLLLASCDKNCVNVPATANFVADKPVENKKMPPPPAAFELSKRLTNEPKHQVINEYFAMKSSNDIKIKHILNSKINNESFMQSLLNDTDDDIKNSLDEILPKATDNESKTRLLAALNEKDAGSSVVDKLIEKGYQNSVNAILASTNINKAQLAVDLSTDEQKDKLFSILDTNNPDNITLIKKHIPDIAQANTYVDNLINKEDLSAQEKLAIVNNLTSAFAADKTKISKKLADKIVADDKIDVREKVALLQKTQFANNDEKESFMPIVAVEIAYHKDLTAHEKLDLLKNIKDELTEQDYKNDITPMQLKVIDTTDSIVNDFAQFKHATDGILDDKDKLAYYYNNHVKDKDNPENIFVNIKSTYANNTDYKKDLLSIPDIKNIYFAGDYIKDKNAATILGYTVDLAEFDTVNFDDLDNLIENYKFIHLDKNDNDNEKFINTKFQELVTQKIGHILSKIEYRFHNAADKQKAKEILEKLIDNCGGIDEFNTAQIPYFGNSEFLKVLLRQKITNGSIAINPDNQFNEFYELFNYLGINLNIKMPDMNIGGLLSMLAKINQITTKTEQVLITTLKNLIHMSNGVNNFKIYLDNAAKITIYNNDWYNKKITLNPLANILYNNTLGTKKLRYFIVKNNLPLMPKEDYLSTYFQDKDNITKLLTSSVDAMLDPANPKTVPKDVGQRFDMIKAWVHNNINGYSGGGSYGNKYSLILGVATRISEYDDQKKGYFIYDSSAIDFLNDKLNNYQYYYDNRRYQYGHISDYVWK